MANFKSILPLSSPCFVALAANEKYPITKNWLDNGVSYDAVETKKFNVGIILGQKSQILDVDLDCLEAVKLADIILPVPHAVFERGADNSAHYFYRARTFGHRKHFCGKNKSTIVE